MTPHHGSVCLVTGGAGFIGCALSKRLADKFQSVIAVDNLHPQVHHTATRPSQLDERVELIVGDVCDAAVWDRVLTDHFPTVFVHLAAETGTAQSLTESSRHAMTNVVGTTAMLDGLMRHKLVPDRIILSSSRAVYGEGLWINETDGHHFYPGQRSLEQLEKGAWDFPGATVSPMTADSVRPMPVSIYGATKLAQEHVIDCWTKATGSELTTLRLQNVYGPGQSLTNSYTGIVSLFCQLAKSGKRIPLYEDGLVQRDFIFIEDIADAFVRAIDAEQSIFVADIGYGHATTLLELATMIADMYRAPAPEVVGKFRLGDVRHAFADSSHAMRELDWKPQVPLKQGLEALAAWIDQKL